MIRLLLQRFHPTALAALAVGALAGSAGLLGLWRAFSRNPDWPKYVDFELYLIAANALSHGLNPYNPTLYPSHPYDYAYPPLIAEVVAFLIALVGVHDLKFVWPVLNVSALFACIVLLLRGFGTRIDWPWIGLAFGCALLSYTVRVDLYHGQVQFLILALLLIGCFLREEGAILSSAIAWALMANIKPFMGIVVLLSLRRREWKLASSTFILSAFIFAASFAPAIYDLWASLTGWLEVQRAYTSFELDVHPNNQSFWALCLRLFNENAYSQHWIAAPWMTHVIMIPVAFALVWLCGRAIPWGGSRGPSDESGARALLELGMVVGAWMCISPATEGDHRLLLAPGLAGSAAIAANRLSERAASARLWLAALAFWIFAMIVQLLPFLLPLAFTTRDTWAWLTGPGVLLSGYGGFCMFGAIALSSFALAADSKYEAKNVAAPSDDRSPYPA